MIPSFALETVDLLEARWAHQGLQTETVQAAAIQAVLMWADCWTTAQIADRKCQDVQAAKLVSSTSDSQRFPRTVQAAVCYRKIQHRQSLVLVVLWELLEVCSPSQLLVQEADLSAQWVHLAEELVVPRASIH